MTVFRIASESPNPAIATTTVTSKPRGSLATPRARITLCLPDFPIVHELDSGRTYLHWFAGSIALVFVDSMFGNNLPEVV